MIYFLFFCSSSEFCGDSLSRFRFTRALSKLNGNTLHLCFSQVSAPTTRSRNADTFFLGGAGV